MNATRAATIRGRAWVGGVVSLGRVQTPTLAMIVRREREIQAFVPVPYWLVRAQFDPRYEGLWFEGDETRLAEARARGRDRREGLGQGRQRSSRSSARSSPSARPCSTTSHRCSVTRTGAYGFSARRTLQAAQSLYEGKKAITYPRTNSRYLSGDLVAQIKPTAGTLLPIPEYADGARFVMGLARLPLGRVVNDAQRRGSPRHHLRPTSSTT